MINYPKHIPSFKVIKRKMKMPADKQALNFEERLNEFLTATV
jgi:hypothetical protein